LLACFASKLACFASVKGAFPPYIENMNYRNFGKLDWKASALGLGCMRLPTDTGDWLSPNVDEQKAIELIRTAIDSGVNYIDTAYPYHNGNSEIIVGKALRNGYREKVHLATKCPSWLMETTDAFDRILDEQLKKLQTDSVDFYLIHALNKIWWHDLILKNHILSRAEAALKDGRIKHLGFSFHDQSEVFHEILNGYDGWSFCQIQYNYMNTNTQAGTRGLKAAAEKGLAVVIMEPLLGGRLANPPKVIKTLLDNAPGKPSAADLALQWLWDQPEVSVVLSGMSNMKQLQENLSSASHSSANSLTPAQRALIAQAQKIYAERTQIPCTKCSYCQPCPNGVNIPFCFEIYNDAFLHEDMATARMWYEIFLGNGARGKNADACIGCRDCESRCPQKIPISEWMPKVHEFLSAPAA